MHAAVLLFESAWKNSAGVLGQTRKRPPTQLPRSSRRVASGKQQTDPLPGAPSTEIWLRRTSGSPSARTPRSGKRRQDTNSSRRQSADRAALTTCSRTDDADHRKPTRAVCLCARRLHGAGGFMPRRSLCSGRVPGNCSSNQRLAAAKHSMQSTGASAGYREQHVQAAGGLQNVTYRNPDGSAAMREPLPAGALYASASPTLSGNPGIAAANRRRCAQRLASPQTPERSERARRRLGRRSDRTAAEGSPRHPSRRFVRPS